MKIIPLLFKVAILLLPICLLHAQNAPEDAVVTIDPVTGLTDKNFPFDKSFYAKLKLPVGDDVYSVGIVKISNNGDREIKTPQILFNVDTVLYETIKDEPGKKFIKILMPPLSPNRLYDIVIYKALSGEPLKILLEVNQMLYTRQFGPQFLNLTPGVFPVMVLPPDVLNELSEQLQVPQATIPVTLDSLIFTNSPAFGNQYNLYQAISDGRISPTSRLDPAQTAYINRVLLTDAQTATLFRKYNGLRPFFWGQPLLSNPTYHLWYYQEIFTTSLLPLYTRLNGPENFIGTDITELSRDTARIHDIYKTLVAAKSTNKDALKILNNLYFGRTLGLTLGRLNGDTTVNANYNATAVPAFDLSKRIIISEKNKSLLTSLNEEIKNLMIVKPVLQQTALLPLILEIDNILAKLTTRIATMKEVISTMNSFDNLKLKTIVSANTHFIQISDEANTIVIPDFGLLFVPNKTQNILRPFLGVNINFGPVNKDVKTRFLSKKTVPGDNLILRHIRNHVSLTAGVVLGSIKIENERDDLFNSVNIFTGGAYRINRAIRFSGGVLWYNNESDSPLLSTKKISGYGYAAISFDISFKNASGSTFSSIFK